MVRLLAALCLLLASASALVAPIAPMRPVVAARAPSGVVMKTAALNKAARLSNKRRLYNRAHRSEMRTAIKRVRRIFARRAPPVERHPRFAPRDQPPL